MNLIGYFKRNFLPVVGVACAALAVSCTDDIEIGRNVDEGAYEAATRVDGMLLDQATNKNQSVVELRGDSYTTNVYFRLTQLPKKGVDVKVAIDPAYLETYNAAHNTAFELYPAELVTIAHDGALLLAPDEKTSIGLGVTIKASDAIQADVTYAIPLKATSVTEGITLSEAAQHAVLLVKNYRGLSDCHKGKDAIKTVLYFEVNDVNPLNALEFALKNSGKLLFDEVVLFSANMNYNRETGRVYVYNNPNVQFLLDHNDEYLQPLRKRGIKVILGILGNHDESGVGQLSSLGSMMFAQDLASICYAYNLDGVGYDDEYSNAPDLSNPLFAPVSVTAASRLLYESKRAMPDKTVMVYYLGTIYSNIEVVDGVMPSEFVDYAVADYGGYAQPMKGMTKKNCSGMSIELARGSGDESEETARERRNQGYGYYMFFALDPSKYSYQVGRVQEASRGNYDDEVVYPTHYYKKNDTTRYKL